MRFFKILLRYLSLYLPRQIRSALFRKQLTIPLLDDEGVVIKIASEMEELDEAFKLLHESYVANNYMKKSESKLRLVVYQSLPTTSVIIAKYKGKVIGTVSIIQDNFLNLPMDKCFNLDFLRKGKQHHIAEVSSLAIDRNTDLPKGAVLFAIVKYIMKYGLDFCHLDFLAIAVNPNMQYFYEDILLFKKINSKTLKKYDFVNGASAVGLYLDLKNLKRVIKKVYQGKKDTKSLFHYYYGTNYSHICHYPKREYAFYHDPCLNVDNLFHFFHKKGDLFNKLDLKTFTYILNSYGKFNLIFENSEDSEGVNLFKRHHIRHKVKIEGRLIVDHEYKMTVQDISRGGLGIYIKDSEGMNFTNRFCELTLSLQGIDDCHIKIQVIHSQEPNFYGVILLEGDKAWQEMIDYADSRYHLINHSDEKQAV
jgi:hypothetical protein